METELGKFKNQKNIIDYLKNDFHKRHHNNSKYSLRSYANTLQLSSSFLSKLLNGKRSVTPKTFKKITYCLNINPEEILNFNVFSDELKNSSQKIESTLVEDNQVFNKITLDQLQLISEWYHFAILELITLENFNPHPNAIAAHLGISSFEAKEALNRMIRLGFIKVKKTNKGLIIFQSSSNTSIGPEVATSATLKQQEAFLKLAIQAMKDVPIEERSQTSMTMAIPKSRLIEAKKLITDFRKNMTNIMQRKGKRDSVYQLTISFYPLTKKLGKIKK